MIPEATKTIASDAFDGCVNMQSIDVEEGNTYFMSYDNALYTANGVTLYRCPQGARTIEVYDGTKMIGENAFYGCKLGKVTLPESVTTVEDGAFDGSEIQTLCLGKALETFGEQNTSFKIHSIEVPGSAPAAPKLVETYGAIVVTDYKPDDTEDTEKPTEDTEKPTEDTEKPTEDTEKPTEDTEKPADDNNNNNNNNNGNNNSNNNNSNTDNGTNGNQSPGTQTVSKPAKVTKLTVTSKKQKSNSEMEEKQQSNRIRNLSCHKEKRQVQKDQNNQKSICCKIHRQ